MGLPKWSKIRSWHRRTGAPSNDWHSVQDRLAMLERQNVALIDFLLELSNRLNAIEKDNVHEE